MTYNSYMNGDLDPELNNVLFTPLITPAFPTIDIDKLNTWLIETYQKAMEYNYFFSKLRLRPDTENADWYPWHLTVAHWDITGVGEGFVNNFDVEFPDILNYVLDCWHITKEQLGTLIFLPLKHNNTGYGFWHSDPEPYGLRHYISFNRNDVNTLLLRKTKEFYNRFDLHRYHPKDIVETICYDTEYRCDMPLQETRAFFLNNTNCMHTTYTTQPGHERICLISTPKIINNIAYNFYQVNKKLILDSAEYYKNYSIKWG